MYATTRYIFMYIPEDAMDENIIDVEAGYSGSSRDHYYRSIGATMEASSLLCHERACGCQPCLKLQRDCTLISANVSLMAGTTPRASTVVLKTACPAPASRHTRNARNPLPEFCRGLKVGKNIVVWVSNEEKEANQDKDYFVAKIGERAVKLEEDGTYRAVPFRKNDWIVSVHWYDFAP